MTDLIIASVVAVIGGLAMWASTEVPRLWTWRAWYGRGVPERLTCGACRHWCHRRRAWGHCTGPGGWTKLWWSCPRFEDVARRDDEG